MTLKKIESKTNEGGATSLAIAAQMGKIEMVRALVAAGADTDRVQCQACTALFLAADQGHADVGAVLIAAGCAIEKANEDGLTPCLNRSAPIFWRDGLR